MPSKKEGNDLFLFLFYIFVLLKLKHMIYKINCWKKYHYIYILLLFWGCISFSCRLSANTPDSLDNYFKNYISSDTLFVRYLQEQHIKTTFHNELELLTSGREKFEHLFREIEKAKKHIHLEYFNFRNDSIARELFEILIRKSEEGVKVRAMFDAFGNMSNNRPLRKKHLKILRDKGIDIRVFDPIRFPYINHAFSRDHQKIVVIDGKVGYTGGMNIADYYINGLPKVGQWRDMHVCIKGPAVEELQKAFLHTWNKETKQHINGPEFFPFTAAATQADSTRGSQVAIVQRIPKETPEAMRDAYIAAINSARHKIQIINPYFTPTASIRKALEKAIKRGVRVDIMIPGKSDIPFTPDAALYIANSLRKKGAHIYIYNGGFHHSKIMMIDERFCTVGSTNLNSRSLRYDYEINAFILDLPVTAELTEIFRQDKADSTVLTKEEYKKRSIRKRILGWFAHLFTPVL